MKKLSAIALALSLSAVISLCACNAEKENAPADDTPKETEKVSVETNDTEEIPAPENPYGGSQTNAGNEPGVIPQVLFENDNFLIAATGLDFSNSGYRVIANFDFVNKSDKKVEVYRDALALNGISSVGYARYVVGKGETKAISFEYSLEDANKAIIKHVKEVSASFRVVDYDTCADILTTGVLSYLTKDTSDFKQETNFDAVLLRELDGVEVYSTYNLTVDNAGHLYIELLVKNNSGKSAKISCSSLKLDDKDLTNGAKLDLTIHDGLVTFSNITVFKANLNAAGLDPNKISRLGMEFDIEFLE